MADQGQRRIVKGQKLLKVTKEIVERHDRPRSEKQDNLTNHRVT